MAENMLCKRNGHVYAQMANAMREVFEVRKELSLNTIGIFTYITLKDRYLN